MSNVPVFQGPQHQRILSISDAARGDKRRSRLCSDEQYISLLNSNAFDFKPSSSSEVSLVIRSGVQQSNEESNESSVQPSAVATLYRPLRPFLPQPPGPSHLNTTSIQAPELDPSSASVTPVSPKTPPSFLNLTSSTTLEVLNSKAPHLSLPSILPTPPPSTAASTSEPSITSTTHSLLRLGFVYVPEILSLICLHCDKPRILYRGILRSHLRKHISESSFQSLICELEHLVSQLPSFAKSIEEVPRRQCGRPALPFLPVLRGFRCLLCDFCAVSSRYVDNHWGEKHKGAPRPSVLYAPASLQTLGGSRQLTRLFWVV